MAKSRGRSKKQSQGERELEALQSRRGRGPEWWDTAKDLQAAHRRGAQLVAGGAGAGDPDQHDPKLIQSTLGHSDISTTMELDVDETAGDSSTKNETALQLTLINGSVV